MKTKRILFAGFLIGFCFFIYNYTKWLSPPLSEKTRIVREIESKMVKKLQLEMGLIPYGFGAQMMDQIEMLALIFQYNHPVDLQEGRRLLVKAVVEYIKEINSNEKIRQYLHKYPFQNVEIMIILRKPDGSDVDCGSLEVLYFVRGKLEFNSKEQGQINYKNYIETFEEAYKIVNEEIQKAM